MRGAESLASHVQQNYDAFFASQPPKNPNSISLPSLCGPQAKLCQLISQLSR
jgi:hypothetical protein